MGCKTLDEFEKSNSVLGVWKQPVSTAGKESSTRKRPYFNLDLILLGSAEEKTRTSTPFRAHEPESCASTNSATSATSN